MANHKQALKRIRQTEVRTDRNRTQRSTLRSTLKKFDTALEAGNKEEIGSSFKTAMSQLHRAVSKGLVKKATASRNISRMSARIKKAASAS